MRFNKTLFISLLISSNLVFGSTGFNHTVLNHTIALKEKIGQMLIIGFEGKMITARSPVVEAIAQHNIGGVILFDYNPQAKQFDKNIASPKQVKSLNEQLQLANKTANLVRHRDNIPLLISVDYEGGNVNRLGKQYGFPDTYTARSMGQMPIDEVSNIANTMADTLQSTGFNLDFAPVLDVNVNPENPIIAKKERSFSSNPEAVAQFSQPFAQQFLAKGIECAYKHFPGHGSSTSDSHLGFVDVTDTWQEQELIPYRRVLAQPNHCGMIMTAHIINRNLDASGVPATLSHAVLTDLLRHELNFEGVIITDDMQMKAISANYGLEQALTMAINAGADMFIFGNQLTDKPQDPAEIIDIIAHQVEQGEISENRIDEAYAHIVKFKQHLVVS